MDQTITQIKVAGDWMINNANPLGWYAVNVKGVALGPYDHWQKARDAALVFDVETKKDLSP